MPTTSTPPGALDRAVAVAVAVAANDHEAAAADSSRDPAVLAAHRQRLSWAAAGARYRARLEELRGQRRFFLGGVEVRAKSPG